MGRRKRKSSRKHLLCNICCDSNSPSNISIPCCSSYSNSSEHVICDQCLGKYIFTIISKDITSKIICPKQGCNAILKRDTIQAALLVSNHHGLWQEYLLKSNWHGTSEQWIKQFTVKCPGCRIPIEKNGGCNHMTCKVCRMSFSWEQAKNGYLYQCRIRWRYWWRTWPFLFKVLFYVCLIICIFIFVKFFLLRL